MSEPSSSSRSGKSVSTPAELVSGVVRLVSLPEVCIRVNEMLDDPHASAADFGKVIGQDTGLTARLLKIVNSSFYGFPSRIETVSRAVTVIGLRELRGLVLAASAVETFSRIPSDVLNMVRFWRHSVYTGVVAQALAEQASVLHSERLFVAGLLHDIGKLIIAHRLPEAAADVQTRLQAAQQPDFVIERERLGFDHAEVGGELIRAWQMPASLGEAVRYHHDPLAARDYPLEAALVHIANSMTGLAERGLDVDVEMVIQPIEPAAWETVRLDESVMDTVFDLASERFTEALEIVLPRSTPLD